jgi:hypothetical protein
VGTGELTLTEQTYLAPKRCTPSPHAQGGNNVFGVVQVGRLKRAEIALLR